MAYFIVIFNVCVTVFAAGMDTGEENTSPIFFTGLYLPAAYYEDDLSLPSMARYEDATISNRAALIRVTVQSPLEKSWRNSYSDYYYQANEVAKQMGVTTAEIINQASAWSRLGYSSAEAASKMAKYSSMFASISPGMNVDTATDGLVSVMKAFDIGNDNPDDVLDGIMSKINIIGNTAATSNAEIVNMLTRSSSAMKEANNTLEETIALETAAVEITRDDASVGMYLPTNIVICY